MKWNTYILKTTITSRKEKNDWKYKTQTWLQVVQWVATGSYRRLFWCSKYRLQCFWESNEGRVFYSEQQSVMYMLTIPTRMLKPPCVIRWLTMCECFFVHCSSLMLNSLLRLMWYSSYMIFNLYVLYRGSSWWVRAKICTTIAYAMELHLYCFNLLNKFHVCHAAELHFFVK